MPFASSPGRPDDTPRAGLNLTRYQKAVIDFVQARDLTDLVVVGHSLGGGTLTRLAPALSARILRFVILAAIVPGPEQSLFDFVPEGRREFYREAAAASRDGTFKVSYETARAIFFEELSEARAREAYGRLTPQSLAAWSSSRKCWSLRGSPRRMWFMTSVPATAES